MLILIHNCLNLFNYLITLGHTTNFAIFFIYGYKQKCMAKRFTSSLRRYFTCWVILAQEYFKIVYL